MFQPPYHAIEKIQPRPRRPRLRKPSRPEVGLLVILGLFLLGILVGLFSPKEPAPQLIDTDSTPYTSAASVPYSDGSSSTNVQFTQHTPTPPTTPTWIVHRGVNGNPWGYDFNSVGGSKIYGVLPSFCSGQYFTCIPSFNNGGGYVVECGDGLFSRSGGRDGSCSYHGGEKAILYSH